MTPPIVHLTIWLTNGLRIGNSDGWHLPTILGPLQMRVRELQQAWLFFVGSLGRTEYGRHPSRTQCHDFSMAQIKDDTLLTWSRCVNFKFFVDYGGPGSTTISGVRLRLVSGSISYRETYHRHHSPGLWPIKIRIDGSSKFLPQICAVKWRASSRSSGLTLCKASWFLVFLSDFILIWRAQSLRELHDRGVTRDQIESALRIMPFVRRVKHV